MKLNEKMKDTISFHRLKQIPQTDILAAKQKRRLVAESGVRLKANTKNT